MSVLKSTFGLLRYFLWIIVPVIFLLIYLIWGLPHLRWSYSWRDEGLGYDPFAPRHYTRCTYLGLTGNFTTHPSDGQCSIIRFSKQNNGGN